METTNEMSSPEKKAEETLHQAEKSSHESTRKAVLIAVVISLIVGSSSGAVFGIAAAKYDEKSLAKVWQSLKAGKVPSSELALKSASKINNVSLMEEDSAVIDVVQKDAPAVVSIVISKDVPKLNQYYSNPFFDDPFFNPFGFQDPGNNQQRPQNQPQNQPQTEKQEIGGGSGFIISSDGYIVTNKHVAEDSTAQYTVITNDGKKYDAKILAQDPFNDVAVLKVEATNLPTIELGSSDSLKIGQTVIAIGNSLGEFRNTVSKGIVSGLKRSVNAGDGMGQSELLEEVIQTDAAINPGNSGGPLLNLSGQVVGINVAMAQGAQNIGFSIPIDQVKKTLDDVKTKGKISRPYLGIRYMLVDDQIQKANNLPFSYGALVVRGANRGELAVIPGSPAAKAGVVENDIILEIDGKRINADNDLSKAIKDKNVGDTVTLTVWSNGQQREVKLVLEEASS